MKLFTSLLSSVFLLSALSNVTGVRWESDLDSPATTLKNLKDSDLDSPASLGDLRKKDKKKKCRPAKVDLEDYSLWSQNSGYWFERRTYKYLNYVTYDEYVFEKFEVKRNKINIKSFYVNDSQQYYDSATLQAKNCFTKKNKEQKNGIVHRGIGSVYSSFWGETFPIKFYGNPHVSKNEDKLNLEVTASIGSQGTIYESRTSTLYNGDPKYVGYFMKNATDFVFFNANTTKTYSGLIHVDYGGLLEYTQQYHGNGFKLDNEDSISTLLDVFDQTVTVLDDEFYNFFGLPIPEI